MDFASGLLHVDSNMEGAVLLQRWTGRANELRPAQALDGYFASVIDRARESGLTIEHHFEKLEYFNSSFISWIVGHVRRTFEVKVKTIIFFEPKSSMHRSSFDALKHLQGDNPWLQVLEARPPS